MFDKQLLEAKISKPPCQNRGRASSKCSSNCGFCTDQLQRTQEDYVRTKRSLKSEIRTKRELEYTKGELGQPAVFADKVRQQVVSAFKDLTNLYQTQSPTSNDIALLTSVATPCSFQHRATRDSSGPSKPAASYDLASRPSLDGESIYFFEKNGNWSALHDHHWKKFNGSHEMGR